LNPPAAAGEAAQTLSRAKNVRKTKIETRALLFEAWFLSSTDRLGFVWDPCTLPDDTTTCCCIH